MSQTFTALTHSLSTTTLLRVKKFLNTQLCPRRVHSAAASPLLWMPVPNS